MGRKQRHLIGLFLLFLLVLGCNPSTNAVKETDMGYSIGKGTKLTLILANPLSSNTNKRGNSFTTTLKDSLNFKEKFPCFIDNGVGQVLYVIGTGCRIHDPVEIGFFFK